MRCRAGTRRLCSSGRDGTSDMGGIGERETRFMRDSSVEVSRGDGRGVEQE